MTRSGSRNPQPVELGERKNGESVCYSVDGTSIFATSEKQRARPVIEVKRKIKKPRELHATALTILVLTYYCVIVNLPLFSITWPPTRSLIRTLIS